MLVKGVNGVRTLPNPSIVVDNVVANQNENHWAAYGTLDGEDIA